MSEEGSILVSVRESVVGTSDNKEFDKDLLPYINSALVTLNQNGIGRLTIVTDESQTWDDFKDPTQIIGNEYFGMAHLYVNLYTQILFDPPPPSNVEWHSNRSNELLWRLKIAYET